MADYKVLYSDRKRQLPELQLMLQYMTSYLQETSMFISKLSTYAELIRLKDASQSLNNASIYIVDAMEALNSVSDGIKTLQVPDKDDQVLATLGNISEALQSISAATAAIAQHLPDTGQKMEMVASQMQAAGAVVSKMQSVYDWSIALHLLLAAVLLWAWWRATTKGARSEAESEGRGRIL